MKHLLLGLLLLTSAVAGAQKVTGYWYGNANVMVAGNNNNYLIEIILDQKSGSQVQGIINYYFKNTYRSFKANGVYNATTRTLQFFDIPVTYFGSTTRFEVDCMMDFVGQLRVAKAGSSLNGSFVAKKEYRNTCPEIGFAINLNEQANNRDSILTALREYKETYQLWTPSATDTAVAATIIQRPIVNYVVADRFKERTKVVAQEIEVESDSLVVDFYDNGEVDGDSISVFYNDKLLASSQRLSAKSVQLKLTLDSLREYNEVAMFADNLGSIPPNTALMILYDGKQRHEVRISSTLQNNGTVRIRRKKSKP